MVKALISRTHLKNKTKRKTNLVLVETIKLAMKNKAWAVLAHKLSGPTRLHSAVNLSEIEEKAKSGDTIVIPGKILSSGDLTKKVRICALSISESANDKLKASKSEFVTIMEEIKKNTKAEGVKILA